ncbi:MAG TPA: cbb3-type cytochrome c oxidase subunit II [Verrucomicrobiae bacterium]
MKNGFAIFFAVLVALGSSWLGLVVAPAIQLGTAKLDPVLNSSDTWPQQRTGEATLGLQIYRANGCAACHTEQVRQAGVQAEVSLTGLGKSNPAEFKAFVQSLFILPELEKVTNNLAAFVKDWNGDLPKTFLTTDDLEAAGTMADRLKAAGLKSETLIVATGPDIARGWGVRRSVAADYLYDYPVQLGGLRVGPDLANIGVRDPVASAQLLHLYAPGAVVKNSAMPSFKFLFEVRQAGATPSPDALNLPKEFAPPAGYEVVPKPEARELVAYLLSLRADQPVYEAPFTPAITKP